MTDSYDHNGNRITSAGEEGFFVVDFSRFTDTKAYQEESINTNGLGGSKAPDWVGFHQSLPKQEANVEPTPPADLRRMKRVLDMVENIDIVEEAKDYRVARDKPEFVEPPFFALPDLMALPEVVTDYKITDLWPAEGNVLFAAPAKFGKSTVVMNLLRSLMHGTPFLGFFKCPELANGESLLLIDLEMSQSRVSSELRAQGLINNTGLFVAPLRGAAKAFDIMDSEVRAHWVNLCKQHNVKTLILDPLAPLLGYLNIDENDNTMVNRFFQQLDEFKKEAGIREMMVVHHCGHAADWRPRGASRFNDWPDALWLAKINGPVNDPASPREFFARGRDVWESLMGEGTITPDPLNPKKLSFSTQSAATQQVANGVKGALENLLHGNRDGMVLPDKVDKATGVILTKGLITRVQEYIKNTSSDPEPTTNKVETVIKEMIKDNLLHAHIKAVPGQPGVKPTHYWLPNFCTDTGCVRAP